MIILTSSPSTPDGCFGVLAKDGTDLCVTVEKPWANNHPDYSCIPSGTWHFRAYQSPTKGLVWRCDDVPGRTAIEVHIANFALELEGCIAPGKAVGLINGRKGVLHSAEAFRMLLVQLPSEFDLIVKRADGEGVVKQANQVA